MNFAADSDRTPISPGLIHFELPLRETKNDPVLDMVS